MLGSLRGVDLVRMFEEDAPEKLIRKLRADPLMNGADCAVDRLVGVELA